MFHRCVDTFRQGKHLLLRLNRLDFNLCVFFDVRHDVCTVFADKTDGFAFGAGTSCAADAVDIVLRMIRQVVVDDMRDAGNMDSARGNIGCNDDFDFARFEFFQNFQALCLRNVTGEELRLDSVFIKMIHQIDIFLFPVSENVCARRFVPGEP